MSTRLAPVAVVVLLGCTADGTKSPADTSGDSATPDSGPPPDSGTPPAPCALPTHSGSTTDAPLLDAATLLAPAEPSGTVDEAAFGPPPGAGPPLHAFSGRLELFDEADGIMDTLVADTWVPLGQQVSTLPEVDLGFVPCGDHLVPEQRGRIITDDLYWDLFVGPGRAWSTEHDGGMSRAAVPFALAFKVENCMQNGVLTFLYDDESVSQVRYQVTAETCPWHIFDLYGQSEAAYTPGAVDDVDALQQAFLTELDHRFEVRPLTTLADDHPGVDLDALDRGLTLEAQTARGILVDDVLYLASCPTRAGEAVFCEEVLLPTYSLAKTLHLGLTSAVVEHELDVDLATEDLALLLPDETAAAPGQWSGVTVEHLIDMTTGHYRSPEQTDDYMGDFFFDYTLAGRLEASLLFPYQEPPGERMVYLTPASQVAAAALDVILAREGSAITDSFDLAVERVYKPAGMTADSFTVLRTWEDGGQNNGTAFGGYGMVVTPHGMARMGRFLLEGGLVDGVVTMDPGRLAETLFQVPTDVGAPTDFGDWSYNNGMWGYPLDRWGCTGHVPVMFGVSGVTVMLAPNGVVYFAFNDTVEQPIVTVLDQLDAIAPLCGG